MRQTRSRRALAQPCALPALSLSLTWGCSLGLIFSSAKAPPLWWPHGSLARFLLWSWHLVAFPSRATLLQGCQLFSYPFTALSPPTCSCFPLPPANTAISSTALYEIWYTASGTQRSRGGTSSPASCCIACPLEMTVMLASVTNKTAPLSSKTSRSLHTENSVGKGMTSVKDVF